MRRLTSGFSAETENGQRVSEFGSRGAVEQEIDATVDVEQEITGGVDQSDVFVVRNQVEVEYQEDDGHRGGEYQEEYTGDDPHQGRGRDASGRSG